MKVLIVDDSKREKKGFKKALILTGLIIDIDKIVLLEKSLDNLRDKYSLKHFKDNKKEKNLEFTEELKKILFENDVEIISAIYGEKALSGFKNINEGYSHAFKFLLERFFININKKNNYGLIIHDTVDNKKYLKKIYELIKTEKFSPKWTKKQTHYSDRIYPFIFVIDDKYSCILQAVDLISRSISSAYSKLREELKKENTPLKEIKNKIEDLKNKNDYLKIYWDLFIKKPKSDDPSNYGIKMWV